MPVFSSGIWKERTKHRWNQTVSPSRSRNEKSVRRFESAPTTLPFEYSNLVKSKFKLIQINFYYLGISKVYLGHPLFLLTSQQPINPSKCNHHTRQVQPGVPSISTLKR